jgi:uncharacterized protein
MPTVLITGGTGLIGRALTKDLLEKDYQVIILTRNPEDQISTNPQLSYTKWNPDQQTIDRDAISKADYIINLAGAGVADKRWTKKRKLEIVSSRVNSGKLIAYSLKTIPNNVKAVISASAIGWYGSSPPNPSPQGGEGNRLREFEETDPAASDFLGTTCKQWEESIDPVTQLGKRLVKLRTGIVLSNEGGALKEFAKPLRFGIAAILGSGRQIMSWIHMDDLVRMYRYAIENEHLHGIYNAVAPKPVSNKEFTMQLARIKRGAFFVPVPVPSFILKVILGEMSIEVLKSAAVSCSKIHVEGFVFQFPSIDATLKNLNRNGELKNEKKNTDDAQVTDFN